MCINYHIVLQVFCYYFPFFFCFFLFFYVCYDCNLVIIKKKFNLKKKKKQKKKQKKNVCLYYLSLYSQALSYNIHMHIVQQIVLKTPLCFS